MASNAAERMNTGSRQKSACLIGQEVIGDPEIGWAVVV